MGRMMLKIFSDWYGIYINMEIVKSMFSFILEIT